MGPAIADKEEKGGLTAPAGCAIIIVGAAPPQKARSSRRKACRYMAKAKASRGCSLGGLFLFISPACGYERRAGGYTTQTPPGEIVRSGGAHAENPPGAEVGGFVSAIPIRRKVIGGDMGGRSAADLMQSERQRGPYRSRKGGNHRAAAISTGAAPLCNGRSPSGDRLFSGALTIEQSADGRTGRKRIPAQDMVVALDYKRDMWYIRGVEMNGDERR